MPRTRTSIALGDKFRVLHSTHRGTTIGTLTVTKITRLSDGRLRLTFPRDYPAFPTVEVTVDPTTGRDANGYCEPVRTEA